MPLDKPGCGVSDHDTDCLCDVHVTEPVSVMENWATESFMIRRLLEEMGPDTLHHQASLLELLVRQVDIHDSLVAYQEAVQQNPNARLFEDSKLSGGMRMAIRQMSTSGYKSKQIQEYLNERYDVGATYADVCVVVDSDRRSRRRRNRK